MSKKRKKPKVAHPESKKQTAAAAPRSAPAKVAAVASRRALSDLKVHPNQAHYFQALPHDQLVALAEDIKKHGLKHPVEILGPNIAGLDENTTISGHQRCRASRLNGEKDVEIRIRDDLSQCSLDEIEKHLLIDNQNRRQLSSLEKARVALRLIEIEERRPRGSLEGAEDESTLVRVGQALGMGERNLRRYLAVLAAPIEVQQAVEEKLLSLNLAAQVKGLEADRQEMIAARIARGKSATALIKSMLGERRKPRSFEDFIRSTLFKMSKLDPSCVRWVNHLPAKNYRDSLGLLDDICKLFGTLATNVRDYVERSA